VVPTFNEKDNLADLIEARRERLEPRAPPAVAGRAATRPCSVTRRRQPRRHLARLRMSSWTSGRQHARR
jgi:hypothetical protein